MTVLYADDDDRPKELTYFGPYLAIWPQGGVVTLPDHFFCYRLHPGCTGNKPGVGFVSLVWVIPQMQLPFWGGPP